MNPGTLAEAKTIFTSIARRAKQSKKVTVIIAPPAPFISAISGKGIATAAQDVDREAAGSFTGSVSASELASTGAEYAIVGHSYRRSVGDTDAIVAEKAKRALEAGMQIILCVGEMERDGHAHYLKVIRDQILAVMAVVDKKHSRSIVIAYEPVWAIGKSYDTALKPSDVHEMAIYVRKVAAEILGKTAGLKIPVLYGGSVNFENAQAILRDSSVDGLLIGRQSLVPKEFGNIIEYADSI